MATSQIPYIDGTGINILTLQQIITNIINGTSSVPGLVSIYGPDINVDSNTPDGQWINIFALSNEDIEQLCVQIYDSFDPTQAIGVALDALCQLNSSSLLRQGGTYTLVAVTINVTGSVNLSGLDTSTPYTISDSNGNLYFLIASASLTPGNNILNFQAATIGFVQVLPNTLTIPVTIIAGVNSVNNASVPYQVGQNQETDAQLRIRRAASTAMPSQGFNQSLYAGLLSITGVTQAVIYENDTSTTDGTGTPGHSIWVIVEGGTSTAIADMIYTYRNAGCGMYGSTTVAVPQADGTNFNVSFSPSVDVNLYLSLTVSSLSGGSVDASALIAYLVENYILGIYEVADITSITSLIHQYSTDILVQFAGVSLTAGSYIDSVLPTNRFNILTLSTGTTTVSVV
jgi:hypothetical protein